MLMKIGRIVIRCAYIKYLIRLGSDHPIHAYNIDILRRAESDCITIMYMEISSCNIAYESLAILQFAVCLDNKNGIFAAPTLDVNYFTWS